MRNVFFQALLMLALVPATAQEADTAFGGKDWEKVNDRRQWLLRYEKVDTTDSRTGRRFTVSRAFYFDKVHRQLRAVEIREVHRRHGLRLTYAFFRNQLVSVTIRQPEDECRKCRRQYRFRNQQLLAAEGRGAVCGDPGLLIREADLLKARVPATLQPGYFEWEKSYRPAPLP